MKVVIKNEEDKSVVLSNLVQYFTLNAETKSAKFRLDMPLDSDKYKDVRKSLISCLNTKKVTIEIDNTNKFILHDPEFSEASTYREIYITGSILEWI